MAKPQLTLYLDLISPFAYLAFHVISTSPVFRPCDITYIPVFLGGIMKACGNTPPINIKNKDKWINNERLRWAQLFDIPMQKSMPPGFPKNTIPVQRALTAISLEHPEKLETAFRLLYHASFADHRDVVDKDTLVALLTEILGENKANNILTKSTTEETKKALSANTDQAMADGAFGLPWMVATDVNGRTEGYWGFDHIGQIADRLSLERPGTGQSSQSGWRAML